MAPATWIVTPDKFLDERQVATLRRTMDSQRGGGHRHAVRNAAIIETLLATGLRVSEICSLVVADIFLDGVAANVLVRSGKGRKTRLVAISRGLASYLTHYIQWKSTVGEPLAPNSPLFLSERRGRMHRSAVHRIWKAALRRAGLPARFGVHAARHSFAVEIYRRTRDLRLTQRLLGHASPSTTQLYANLLDDDVRRGVEAIWTS